MALTLQERAEREALVLKMIGEGATTRQIAEHLGVNIDTVKTFLKRRGWQTQSQQQWEKDEKKRQRKKAREAKKKEKANESARDSSE